MRLPKLHITTTKYKVFSRHAFRINVKTNLSENKNCYLHFLLGLKQELILKMKKERKKKGKKERKKEGRKEGRKHKKERKGGRKNERKKERKKSIEKNAKGELTTKEAKKQKLRH